MDRLQALGLVAAEAAEGDLHFPTHARLSLRIRRELDDPGCHVETAGKLVQADPLLAAQLVAVANSVAYNPAGREVSDARSAIARLGFATVRSVLAARIARQIAGAPATPRLHSLADRLWEHTAHVAALARVIARRITGQDPETAFFAGIVHEVGGFYLIARAADYPVLLEAPAEAEETDTDGADAARVVECELGLAVLRRLDVPTAVVVAAEAHGRGYLALPPHTLADTLLLADYLAPLASPLSGTPAGVGAAALDFTLDRRTLSEILAESAAEVASLATALGA